MPKRTMTERVWNKQTYESDFVIVMFVMPSTVFVRSEGIPNVLVILLLRTMEQCNHYREYMSFVVSLIHNISQRKCIQNKFYP